jgi:hypothetical protein
LTGRSPAAAPELALARSSLERVGMPRSPASGRIEDVDMAPINALGVTGAGRVQVATP